MYNTDYYKIKDDETIDENMQKLYYKFHQIISAIQKEKGDIIYKSAFPRDKDTKYRGIKAFRDLVYYISEEYQIHNSQHTINYISFFNERVKEEWLDCFKLVYKHGVMADKIQGKLVLLNTLQSQEKQIFTIFKKYDIIEDHLEKINETSIVKEKTLNFEKITEIENIIKDNLTKSDIIQLIKNIL